VSSRSGKSSSSTPKTPTRSKDGSAGTPKTTKKTSSKDKEKTVKAEKTEKAETAEKPEKGEATKGKVVVEEDGSRWELGDDGYYYCIEEEIVEVEEPGAAEAAEAAAKEAEEQAQREAEEQAKISLHIQRALSVAEEQVRENYGNIFQGIEDAAREKKRDKDGKKQWKKPKEASSDSMASVSSGDDDERRGRSESPRSKRNPRKSRSPANSSAVGADGRSATPSKKRSSRSRSRGRAILTSLSAKKGDSPPESKAKPKRHPGVLTNASSAKFHRSSANLRASSNLRNSRSSVKLPQPATTLERPLKLPPKQSPDYKTTKLFGVDLDVVMARQKRDKVSGKVPKVVSMTVEHIRKHGMTSNGLFRLCGHHSKQMALEAKLDAGETDLDIENIDINTVAALLKSFLHRLPFPLVPRTPFYPLFFSASALTSEETRIRTYIALLHACPRHSLALIRFLCLFLSDVAENHEKTLMTASNLSLIFAPSFFGTLEDDLSVDNMGTIEPLAFSRASKFTASITEQLITNAKMIFMDQPFKARVYKSLECFKALGGSIMTILRGDTLLVIHEDEEGFATVMVGETWGKVPVKVLAEMKEVDISEVQCRDTAALFTNAGSTQARRRNGAETIAIRSSAGGTPPSPVMQKRGRSASGTGTAGLSLSGTLPAVVQPSPAPEPVPAADKKKAHKRGRSLGKMTSDMLKDVLEAGSNKGNNRRSVVMAAGDDE